MGHKIEPMGEKLDKTEIEPVKSLVYVEDSETEDDSSEESVSTSGTNSGSNSGNGTSIEYSISNRSDSDCSDHDSADSTSSYIDQPVRRLDVIVEDDEDDEIVPEKSVIKKKISVKRKRSSRIRKSGSTTEQDSKNGMKSKLASLRKDLKKDEGAHSSSLKNMIFQFETAVAALEMSERQVTQDDSDSDSAEPLALGVKAIAQKNSSPNKSSRRFG